ncbi:hypothetical protein GW17_00008539 [Ensete ventricosum]|nr:hypothetical protein GW17_00008539 [Ensete ventricosum]
MVGTNNKSLMQLTDQKCLHFGQPVLLVVKQKHLTIRVVSATSEVKYLTWHRSVSLLSSSSENFLGALTKDDTQEPSGNIFNGTYMNSGSHASTLDRLYAWERKLYDEVKSRDLSFYLFVYQASGIIRREYDMKCRLLRQKESTKVKPENIDKIRAVVKDLHSRILVAIQRIDSISKKIEEIRDRELEPQLEELIGGYDCFTISHYIVSC